MIGNLSRSSFDGVAEASSNDIQFCSTSQQAVGRLADRLRHSCSLGSDGVSISGGSGGDGWSNGDGQHSCKQSCEGLFAKGEEKTLRDACKATCGSRCQMLKCNGFWPTRANICLARGLSSDCTLPSSPTGYKGTSPTGSPDDRSGGTSGTGTSGTGTNTNETKTGMSTGAKIGIAVGAVAVIGAIVYFGFIRKKG